MDSLDKQDWLTAERDKPKRLECGYFHISDNPRPLVGLRPGEALWAEEEAKEGQQER